MFPLLQNHFLYFPIPEDRETCAEDPALCSGFLFLFSLLYSTRWQRNPWKWDLAGGIKMLRCGQFQPPSWETSWPIPQTLTFLTDTGRIHSTTALDSKDNDRTTRWSKFMSLHDLSKGWVIHLVLPSQPTKVQVLILSYQTGWNSF